MSSLHRSAESQRPSPCHITRVMKRGVQFVLPLFATNFESWDVRSRLTNPRDDGEKKKASAETAALTLLCSCSLDQEQHKIHCSSLMPRQQTVKYYVKEQTQKEKLKVEGYRSQLDSLDSLKKFLHSSKVSSGLT